VTVAAAGALGWMGSRKWWVAGCAAAVVALNPLDVRFGPLVTPDAIAGATTALAVVGALWVLGRPTVGRYVLTGLAVGVAASTKYNAALSAAPLLVAHGLALGRQQAVRRAWLVLLAAVASVAVFLLINPYSVLDNDAFMRGLRYDSRHYRTGHPGSEGGSLGYHLAWLWRGFGPTLLLAPLGVFARGRRVRQAAIVCLSFVVLYVGFISSFEVRFARNLLPATASLAGAIGLGALALVERTARWRTGLGGGRLAGSVGRHGQVAGAV
jgi:4-amino-4-deoxy-L-arabinose transferase-like glycosyltransferase